MNSPNSERRLYSPLPLAALALGLLGAAAHAQQSGLDPSAAYRTLMQKRMEESSRAVSETQRRRFEEGKSDTTFPSDTGKALGKPGVVRALSPEAQKALAHNERGLAHFAKGKLEQAVREYDAAIRAYPALAAAHDNLGSAHFAAGRFEEATAHLRRILQREPADARAHEALAESYLGQRKYEEAIASADRALKLTPDAPGAHYIAGLARASTGRRDTALAHLAKLKELKSDDYAQLLSDFIEKKSPAKQ